MSHWTVRSDRTIRSTYRGVPNEIYCQDVARRRAVDHERLRPVCYDLWGSLAHSPTGRGLESER